MTWRDDGLRLIRRLFLGLLAIIYGIAFFSLWVQLEGLIGSGGVLPAGPYLETMGQRLGADRFRLLPTLCWLGASDGFLHFLCAGGVVLSALAVLWIAPGIVFFLLWGFYLSLVNVGGDFLSFQWDSLLLETGFLAIFLAPWQLRPRRVNEAQPSVLNVWLLRFLLFRLMFSSGVVKLSSDDETWWGLTALLHHYQTQPLPTWAAWLLHRASPSFHQASVLYVFAMELVVPFLIFAPRPFRIGAFFPLVMFQVLILFTGNYCFFNLLTIALCLLLLDDGFLRKLFRRPVPADLPLELPWTRNPLPKRLATGGLAGLVLLLGGVALGGAFRAKLPAVLQPLESMRRLVAPFHAVNHYGLFAVMTTFRPEIIVEGSMDGQRWSPYEFKWKPGELDRRPLFVAPHQPRLDWQMWFAALGSYRRNVWFQNFLYRLLEGSPAVLGLLGRNPFPDAPPRFVRAQLYLYHFSDFRDWRASGAWWRRELRGSYSPTFSLPSRAQ